MRPDYDQENTKVEDIMIPAAELIIMQPTRRADEALRKMTRTRLGRVCICDEEGRLVGLVSKTDIMNAAWRTATGTSRRLLKNIVIVTPRTRLSFSHRCDTADRILDLKLATFELFTIYTAFIF